jgi:hypothetical protein
VCDARARPTEAASQRIIHSGADHELGAIGALFYHFAQTMDFGE